MLNKVNRMLPENVEGYGAVRPFAGAFQTLPDMDRYAPLVKAVWPGESKLIASIEEVFAKIGIKDGMTLSFHHHFRDGDYVLNMVLAVAAKLGLKNLGVASSSIFPVHAPLVDHIKNGVVSQISCTYMAGPVGNAIARGVMTKPAILRTHGGRARALECGQLRVDVAFIAAPAADDYGNLNGVSGPAACGSLGYAMPDSEYADHVVAVTDHLVPYPLAPISIPQTRVDYVVKVDAIGDPKGIVSGTTKITKDPVGLKIAQSAASVVKAAGFVKEGLAFQTGAGGASLAAAHFLAQMMEEAGVTASFTMGGITGYMVKMMNEGRLKRIIDVQDFDAESIDSIRDNPNHLEVSVSLYANPYNSGCVVNKLDTVFLGATEIDTDFNVNVVTGSNGLIMGGSGGHSDAASGAKLTIIVANLLRSRLPTVVDKVLTVTTPGETVDVLVTERGIAVNPRRPELKEKLVNAGLNVRDIHELKADAERIAGKPNPITTTDRIVALVEYRDGTIIDVVRQVMG